jgi:hypothetical protein
MAEVLDSRAHYRLEVARWRAERQLPHRGDAPCLRRCEHCNRLVGHAGPAGGPAAPRYCSEEHRRAGQARARLGLARDVMPGASDDELRCLGHLTRDARAGRRGWGEVVAFSQQQVVLG